VRNSPNRFCAARKRPIIVFLSTLRGRGEHPGAIEEVHFSAAGPQAAGFENSATTETGDLLPQLQRVGILETLVLQAFRWRPPEIVAKTVVEVS